MENTLEIFKKNLSWKSNDDKYGFNKYITETTTEI